MGETKEVMKVSEIKTGAPFKDLFRIKSETLKEIQNNMQQQGYDHGYPIKIWKEKGIVVDGHTRLIAALNLGMREIPVDCRTFKDEDAAIDYARRAQFHRRSLDDGDILWLAIRLDELGKRGKRGGDRRSSNFKTSIEGLITAKFAKERGTSRRKIEEAFYIIDHGDDRIKSQVLNGRVTIHRTCQKLRAQREATIKCEFTKTAMGVSVSRAALCKVLQVVYMGVGDKGGALEGLDTFYFEPKWIRSYNDYESVSYPFITNLPALKGAVHATKCYNVIKQMRGETVELKVNDKGLILSDGTTTLTLQFVNSKVREYIESSLESPGRWRNPVVHGKIKWHPLPSNFMSNLRTCAFSAARNEKEGTLFGVHIHKAEMMTTDRFRGTLCLLDKPMAIENATLSMGSMRKFMDAADILTFTYYAYEDGWFHLKTKDGVRCSTRALIGNFPAGMLRASIKGGENVPLQKFPDGLRASLYRVSPLAGGSGVETDREAARIRFVHLRKENGYLLCEAKVGSGQIVDRIKLSAEECPMDVDVYVPEFILDVLNDTQEFGVAGTQIYCHVGSGFHVMLTKATMEKKYRDKGKPLSYEETMKHIKMLDEPWEPDKEKWGRPVLV